MAKDCELCRTYSGKYFFQNDTVGQNFNYYKGLRALKEGEHANGCDYKDIDVSQCHYILQEASIRFKDKPTYSKCPKCQTVLQTILSEFSSKLDDKVKLAEYCKEYIKTYEKINTLGSESTIMKPLTDHNPQCIYYPYRFEEFLKIFIPPQLSFARSIYVKRELEYKNYKNLKDILEDQTPEILIPREYKINNTPILDITIPEKELIASTFDHLRRIKEYKNEGCPACKKWEESFLNIWSILPLYYDATRYMEAVQDNLYDNTLHHEVASAKLSELIKVFNDKNADWCQTINKIITEEKNKIYYSTFDEFSRKFYHKNTCRFNQCVRYIYSHENSKIPIEILLCALCEIKINVPTEIIDFLNDVKRLSGDKRVIFGITIISEDIITYFKRTGNSKIHAPIAAALIKHKYQNSVIHWIGGCAQCELDKTVCREFGQYILDNITYSHLPVDKRKREKNYYYPSPAVFNSKPAIQNTEFMQYIINIFKDYTHINSGDGCVVSSNCSYCRSKTAWARWEILHDISKDTDALERHLIWCKSPKHSDGCRNRVNEDYVLTHKKEKYMMGNAFVHKLYERGCDVCKYTIYSDMRKLFEDSDDISFPAIEKTLLEIHDLFGICAFSEFERTYTITLRGARSVIEKYFYTYQHNKLCYITNMDIKYKKDTLKYVTWNEPSQNTEILINSAGHSYAARRRLIDVLKNVTNDAKLQSAISAIASNYMYLFVYEMFPEMRKLHMPPETMRVLFMTLIQYAMDANELEGTNGICITSYIDFAINSWPDDQEKIRTALVQDRCKGCLSCHKEIAEYVSDFIIPELNIILATPIKIIKLEKNIITPRTIYSK
jgi:hypothetical protein